MAGSWKLKAILMLKIAVTAISVLLAAAHVFAAEQQDVQPQPRTKPDLTIYPVLAQIPIFGAQISIPDSPGLPGGGTGTTDLSLNGAYMFGVIFETRYFLVDVNNLWAAVSASHSPPLTAVDTDSKFLNAVAGVRVGHSKFFAIGGIKRVGIVLDVNLDVIGPLETHTIDGHAHPVLWDPVGGIEYRGRVTARTTFDGAVKYGGFGIGTDYDLTTEGAVDWSLARHVVLRAGYSFVRFKMTVTHADVDGTQRSLVARQTLHGPEIGFGIHF
jgi:hypothetical protein